jgi:dTDP-4-amino-4,6-dideoxygalactose transaminase
LNSRLDPIQAAALAVKLKFLPEALSTKTLISEQYLAAFQPLKQVVVPETASFSNHTYHQFTLTIPSEKRDGFAEYMREEGISTMVYYPIPLHKQKAYAHFEPRTSLAISEKLSRSVISIPVHEALAPNDILAIKDAITKYFS